MLRPRAILTEQQAIQIFEIRNQAPLSSPTVMIPLPRASCVARKYGVSERTVRDIWTGRTWCRATFSPGTRQQASSDKKPGRPKGSRDSKPRKKKSTIQCHYVGKGRTSPRADTLRFNNITHTKDSQPQQKSISAQQPIAQTVNTSVPTNLSIVNSESVDAQLYSWTQHCGSFSGITDPFHADWEFWPKDAAQELTGRTRDARIESNPEC
jgi:hypothetical protein